MSRSAGLHHVTAICGDPRRNAAFYTRSLGLRMVKRTVNFDEPSAWHLYYGDEEGVQQVGNTIPARRMGNPDDIADVVLFLSSPMARWMTGTNVMVHGGGEIPAYLAASTGDVTKK